MTPPARIIIGLLVGLCLPGLAPAGELALIIDDLGFRADTDHRSLTLPSEVAVAIIPDGPMAPSLDRRAHDQGRDILVHLPLTDVDHPGCKRIQCLRPGDSTTTMRTTLDHALRRLPHARGLNNHMGSGFSEDPLATLRLMASLADITWRQGHRLYVVDSRTSPASQLTRAAGVFEIPAVHRDIFLDHDRDPEAIRTQWQRALDIARRYGNVIVIGHPHPETLTFLESALPEMNRHGVRLVRVPRIVDQESPWPPPSFPSPRVSKSSKPSPSSTCCAGPTSGSP